MFANILAAQKAQIFLGIGGLIGAGLFVNSVVVAAVLIEGGETQLDFTKFVRDSGTCFLAVILLLSYGLLGQVAFWQAVLLPCVYAVYVIIVLYTERTQQIDDIDDLEMPALQPHGSVKWGSLIDDYVKTETTTTLMTSSSSIPAHSLRQNLTWGLLRLKISWETS